MPNFRFLISSFALRALIALAGLGLGSAQAADMPRVLTVSGHGEATGTPDQARLNVGVVTQAKTAADALAGNSQTMNAVFAALKQLGIPASAVQTTSFFLSPDYPPYNATTPEARTIIGYTVTNMVSVTLDDTTKVGPALDALVSAGANQTGGVSFSIRDVRDLAAKARAEAVHDAMEKARTYAAAAGLALGPIVSVQESGTAPILPMMRAAVLAAPAPTPIAAGEETVAANVTISWAIK